MAKLNELRKYFIIFFVFAQDNNIPSINISFKFLVYLPSIVLTFALMSFIAATMSIQTAANKGLGLNGNNVLIALLLCYAIPNIIGLCESLLKSCTIPAIYRQLLITIRYLENKMKIPINLRQFERSYFRKVTAIFLSAILSRFFIHSIKTQLYPPYLDTCCTIIIIFKCFATAHIVYYLDLLLYLLDCINSHFDAQAIDVDRKSFILHANALKKSFQELKLVHFQLRKIIAMINFRFGWIINGLSLEAFLYLTNNIYWIFLYHIISPDSGLLNFRNVYHYSVVK